MGPTQKPEAKSRFQFVEIALVAAVCLLTLPEAWFHWISLRFNPQWAPITTIVGMSMGIASVFIRDDWRTSTTPFIRKLAVFLLTVLIAFAVIRLFSTVPIATKSAAAISKPHPFRSNPLCRSKIKLLRSSR